MQEVRPVPTAFALSKPFVDIGIFTTRGEEMRAFYGDELGLATMDSLDIEPGYVLHRFDARGSALKLNVVDTELAPRRTCHRRIVWPEHGRTHVERVQDPDGNEIDRVPMGHLDVTQVGIVYAMPSLAVAESFAMDALGAEQLAPDRYRVGATVLLVEIDPAAERSGALEALGFTYTTLHVTDTVATHAHLVAHGCTEAIPPTPFGDITTYSFVRDPVGNWIEISRRADLAGAPAIPLPAGAGMAADEVRAVRRRP